MLCYAMICYTYAMKYAGRVSVRELAESPGFRVLSGHFGRPNPSIYIYILRTYIYIYIYIFIHL